jgi:hypothetical protein
MGGIRGLLIVALAVAAVLAQPVSADAKGKGQNKGAARLHGGASAQDILRTPGDARAIRVIRRDRRDGAKTVRKIDSHRRDRDRKVRIVDNKFNHVDRFFGLPPGLAKRDRLPHGLAKRDFLPPGLAKGHGVPPGHARRSDLPPGLGK